MGQVSRYPFQRHEACCSKDLTARVEDWGEDFVLTSHMGVAYASGLSKNSSWSRSDAVVPVMKVCRNLLLWNLSSRCIAFRGSRLGTRWAEYSTIHGSR
jgi:hypothetical protein